MKHFRSFKTLAILAVACLALFSLAIPAAAQSNSAQRQMALEDIPIDAIPLLGYADARPGDAVSPVEPAYTYWGYVDGIRDVDTVSGTVDLGFGIYQDFGFRFYANDGFEITRKGGKTDSHVDRGYKCRDLMVEWLGSDQKFPRKATYHEFQKPIRVVVKSIKHDKYAGRWLFIVHKDGVNLNQLAARSGCAIVTTFGSKPAVYDRYMPISGAIN